MGPDWFRSLDSTVPLGGLETKVCGKAEIIYSKNQDKSQYKTTHLLQTKRVETRTQRFPFLLLCITTPEAGSIYRMMSN